MRNVRKCIPNFFRFSHRFHSTSAKIQAVPTLRGSLISLDIQEFQQRAFLPEEPILIPSEHNTRKSSRDIRPCAVPASVKWFNTIESEHPRQDRGLSDYLSQFGATILPYEFTVRSSGICAVPIGKGNEHEGSAGKIQDGLKLLDGLSKGSSEGAFYRFNAPLSVFIQASQVFQPPQLYIAQAQIADLPKQLQDDLPTPRVVKEAGKGDVYDSNIWLGLPPTYTPLHKDPNPNLFVQLAGRKRIRIFKPTIGSTIYREVQQSIRQSGPASLRGEEMMEGPERHALDELVWGQYVNLEGFEAVVGPGDAVFIPKGWWHSIKSMGHGVTASVNWWFR